jgi:hypothetical protein
MAREEDCSEHGKIEREIVAEDAMIEFPIRSPFKGGIGEGRTMVGRVVPGFTGQQANFTSNGKIAML